MRRKIIKELLVILSLFLSVFGGYQVQANSGASTPTNQTIIAAKEEEKLFDKPLTYENFKDDLDKFTSKVWFKNDRLGLSAETQYFINKLVEAEFWITKVIFRIGSSIYSFTSSVKGFDKAISDTISRTGDVFNEILKGTYIAEFAIASIGFFVFISYFHDNGSFVKVLLKGMLVLVLAMSFYTKGSKTNNKYFAQVFYDKATIIFQDIAKNSTDSLSKLSDSSENAVLDMYFKQAIWEPYRYMNSDMGKNDIDDNGFKLSDKEFKGLLAYKSGNDDFEMYNKSIEKLAGDVKEPTNSMLSDNWGDKFTYATISVLESALLGVIVSASGVAILSFKMFIVVIYTIAPFSLLLSMFPTFENVLFDLFKRLFGAIALSGLANLLVFLVLWYYTVLSFIISSATSGNVLVASALKIVVFIVMYKKREFLIGLMTSNRVSMHDNFITRRLDRAGRSMQKTVVGKSLAPIRKSTDMSMNLAKKHATDKLKAGQRASRNLAMGSFRTIRQAGSKAVENVNNFENRTSEQLSSLRHETLAKKHARRIASSGGDYQKAYVDYKEKIQERQERRESVSDSLKNASDNIKVVKHRTQSAYYNLQAKAFDEKEKKSNPEYVAIKKKADEQLGKSLKLRQSVASRQERQMKRQEIAKVRKKAENRLANQISKPQKRSVSKSVQTNPRTSIPVSRKLVRTGQKSLKLTEESMPKLSTKLKKSIH